MIRLFVSIHDGLDWRPGISQSEMMNRIVTKVKPGSIILFHNDTPHTARMLPDIISALKNVFGKIKTKHCGT